MRKRDVRTKKSAVAKAKTGAVGDWLGTRVEVWHGDFVCNPFVKLGEDGKLHIILVPEEFTDHVFCEIGETYSWSQHLAKKLLVDAVLFESKPNLWHHGAVLPGQFRGHAGGLVEVHNERRYRSTEQPWRSNVHADPIQRRSPEADPREGAQDPA